MKNKQTLFLLASEAEAVRIAREIINIYGLPRITNKLNIYGKHGSTQLGIEFCNQECSFKIKDTHTLMGESRSIRVENNNIKNFFKSLAIAGFNEVDIGHIHLFMWELDQLTNITISFKTFIGTMLAINCESDKTTKIYRKAKAFINKVIQPNNEISQKEKSKLISSITLPKETIFNQYQVLNPKIIKYADNNGIDIRSPNETINARIEGFSNDYSFYEKPYEQITGIKLLSTQKINTTHFLKNMSIVIPCYNSNDTILKTLYSIEYQDIPKSQLSKIEVVIIDDGSIEPVVNIVSPDVFTFPIQIIRNEKNLGLSSARNIGISVSQHDHLLFIDSDILLSKNYILEHSARLQIIPNSLFVSLKKNISRNHSFYKLDSVKNGFPVPESYDDLRIKRFLPRDKPGIRVLDSESYIEIIADSNYFKKFGHGRYMGIYNLPAMVIGHNFSLSREMINKAGLFNTSFKGWGFEDTFFGAQMISNGNFIIPVLSAGVYHINHPPRSGSDRQKQQELKSNLEQYKQLVHQIYQR
ncbi:hypothetical protein A2982_00725 [candidate division WWE3 bacterium RIFCSPLOWO2_01_FULL_39_13]|uniref:Glycosyltransferase 2-like domain-containing protein n=1 Tax=candidate division WWE3 bacterium RIFCSPLOWO2_01_FULL_39_13 TaxID=1802624 RepID=A0A1F4V5F3_UNCKA|nr:MAG: hypothetical protein A2982_00725 [candidate division WWE3 bacterium RIFCSPLOWO2_01_FULL_39_13]